MDRESFVLEVRNLNIDVDDDKLRLLDLYYDLLIEWNEKINLTAIVLKEDVFLKHFYDSLTLCKVVDLNSVESLCDIGTGAGFPGVVLKIFFPHLKLTLVDSLNKRINFLKIVCDSLELDDVVFVHARAEDYAKEHREEFDVVTARAVASLPILAEYCIPLVKVSKYFVALKGNEDISACKEILNSRVDVVSNFYLPFENSARCVIRFKKFGKTSLKYPRKFSEIKKKPLEF